MKNIIVIAYQLHYASGSEYSVAFDYINHMSKNNKLTVIYGTSKVYHNIGNTGEMEEWCRNHSIENVTFIPLKPIFKTKCYSYSVIGELFFYRDYRKWHQSVRSVVSELMKKNKFDLIHFLGPIGYKEPGFLQDLGLPYIRGPIGGFGMIPIKLIRATGNLRGAIFQLVKGILNLLYPRVNKRIIPALKNADVLMCATSEMKEYVEKLCGSNHHSIIIHNPENCINELYPLNQLKFKNILEQGNKINLIFVGSLDSRKALILLLKALEYLPSTTPIMLHIVGDGPLRESLRKYASKRGLDALVKWHGLVPRDKVYELMNNSHMMVLPSLGEANSTVIWEAMSKGVPTMALNHCGFRDTIINGKTGILIDVDSFDSVVKNIANNLIDLVNRPEKLKKMAEAVIVDREKYTWKHRCEFFEEVYELAINQSKKTE